MAKPEAGSEGQKKADEGKAAKILQLVFVALNVAVMAGGGAVVFNATIGYHDPKIVEHEMMRELASERAKREESSVLYKMDKFTVNLDGTPQRVIQVELSLEMLDEQGFEEVVTKGAQARDSIVRVLNAKRFSELEGIQGKLFLKDQVMSSINSILKNGVVKNVYFSHFVVQ